MGIFDLPITGMSNTVIDIDIQIITNIKRKRAAIVNPLPFGR